MCAHHIYSFSINIISNRKEAENKPLFDVFATFDVKTCPRVLYCAIFDVNTSKTTLKRQKLHLHYFFILLTSYSLIVFSGGLI